MVFIMCKKDVISRWILIILNIFFLLVVNLNCSCVTLCWLYSPIKLCSHKHATSYCEWGNVFSIHWSVQPHPPSCVRLTWMARSRRMAIRSWSCRQPAADWGTAQAATGPCRSYWTLKPWILAHEERCSTSLPSTGSTWSWGVVKRSNPPDLGRKMLPS